ncbi:hypothetical protein DQW77_07885 [Roseovarius sp. TE539]|uniref:DUF805 domain-containing protein n=1 Tax=Roseovarius sp. TE539 TaxID=2249812 RepID=UPI000DDCA3B7|nr:DUF805 domain-containing protein [Roseovarius sp. TE539]RBI74100.1 hypothetical protein DQW77_07885 [Roseovarius sp. TE539]
MGPTQAVRAGLEQAFTFRGRASRSEFWWLAPLNGVVALKAGQWAGSYLVFLVFLIPLLNASARRSRDGGYDPIWMGSGIAAVLIGWGIVIVGISPSGGNPTVWPMVTGMCILNVGLLASLLVLISPSKPDPNPNEVPK